MEKKIRIYNIAAAIIIFICLPLLFWSLGDFPSRTLLKEAISLTIIIAFTLMLGQFFLARSNREIIKEHPMSSVVKVHKFIGYFFISVLLLHPFLIVVPRFFEAGISPYDAFITLISTYNITGIFLGISAYVLMLILGLTSMFRKRLGIKYKTWRVFHGWLSIAFIIVSTWHVLLQGRHINLPMSIYIITLAALGVALLFRTYLLGLLNRRNNE